MYFKKLELVGFKSFLDKTTLNFEPGITAIVGPNGCGKSNIFDAIRWVLGEQSVKSLRGSQMQDVIFNGTDSKEPLSMAEVSLSFDNNKRYFAVDQNEVVITRRVFRSGESEYLLNKTLVRLKDIMDLLMGTGIGAENYSLVEQGKIDLILSSRPEDRRLIFDEAAGITKYKVQKKEAMRRLEETEQNLLRVNDIIAEVKRQIGSLERQANKARRYKEIFEELKQKEINLAFIQKNELTAERDNLASELSGLQMSEARLLNMIQEHESKVGSHREDLKAMEGNIMVVKESLLNLSNLISTNEERITFNKEKISEFDANQKYLAGQIEQTKNRLILDEEKLNNLKLEHDSINKNIETKKLALLDKETKLSNLNLSVKDSLGNIAKAKRNILDLATRISNLRNEISDLVNKQQVYLARKKRLEIEKAKIGEEKAQAKNNFDTICVELKSLEGAFRNLGLGINSAKKELEGENSRLGNLNADIGSLEKEKFTLESHKDFLEKLKTKYEDISESMDAVVYLDKQPQDNVTGLVIKIKDSGHIAEQDKANFATARFKLAGEAKPIDLDAQKIIQKLGKLEESISTLVNAKKTSLARIEELNQAITKLQDDFRTQEIALANKRTNHNTILEELNKINEEEEIILMELSDVDNELCPLEDQLRGLESQQYGLNKQQKESEEFILNEQNNIELNNKAKEEALVMITETKTELVAMSKRLDSDQATLKILEDTYQQDKGALNNQEKQIQDNHAKQEGLILEIKNLEAKIMQAKLDIETQNENLEDTQEKYQKVTSGVSDAIAKVESDRKELDTLKNRLYELQMQTKDFDFKITSIKDRVLQAYKIELDAFSGILEEVDKDGLWQDIEKLKEKLDSLGTVNLVAIEEYDELKKRYDFLTQQQGDLTNAKESVHEAILKINRTTKKMFLETFQNVQLEFRNYFKSLFNGGDAQIFLIDEHDPLESGIEIICRPPGKKLQNVLLLSGGEKSLSAIALIFAIFKVKPSPFCVLDEIDAALDEANVDRFSRMLVDFIKDSQFIVITHNKKTIANASVMYGITMQESGVSKIVSVKLGENRAIKDKEPAAAVVQAA